MTRETENSLKPINRLEFFLDEIVNGSDNPYSPVFRVETFLAKIAGKSVIIPEPIFRIEKYLAKICGENVEIPQPIYRIEYWLAAKCGMEITTPDPVYRIEFWLEDWVNGGTPSQTLTVMGISPIVLENAIEHSILSLTQFGKCVQDGTPTPSAPVNIVCNNGALRMLNLANMAESNLDIGYYLNNSGVRTASAPNFYTLGFIPVKPSTTYTMKTSASLNYFNIMEYDSAQGFLHRTLWGTSGSPAGDTTTFTTRSDTAYLRFGSNMNGNTLTYADIAAATWMLTEGATAKDYVPFGTLYTDGTPEVLTVSASGAEVQTASLADLYSVGNVTDEQDIISGAVTHRIGYHVFDGTETFSKSSAYGKAFLINASYTTSWGADRSKAVLCTHFLGLPQTSGSQADNTCFFNSTGHFYFRVTDNSDADAWKAWLAEQYAAGTPVIVFFVLAEETTEQTTPHRLHTAQGTNVVSATAEVSDISLTAEYKGVV